MNLGLLKYHLAYDPITGAWTQRVRGNVVPRDVRSDWAGSHGGRWVYFLGKRYQAHRLAWYYMTGKWPPVLIDHIDCNPSNNRWNNLRCADYAQNTWNSRLRKDNILGHKGVAKSRDKWTARITVRAVSFHLGSFDSLEAAAEAWWQTAQNYHQEFARRA